MIENDETYCILLRCLQCQGKESQKKVERNDGRKKMQSVSVVYYVQPIQ